MILYYMHMLPSWSLRKNKEELSRNRGENFGKQCVYLIVSHSWTWHYFTFVYDWVGKSTYLFFDHISLKYAILGFDPILIQCYQLRITSSICSREVNSQLKSFSIFVALFHINHPRFNLELIICPTQNRDACFVLLMRDTLTPSSNESLPIELNTLSRKLA